MLRIEHKHVRRSENKKKHEYTFNAIILNSETSN